MGLVEDIGPTDQSDNYLTIRSEVLLILPVFLNGFSTPIAISKLVKDLGVQTSNAFSPSAQCTEAANKAKRLIVMIVRNCSTWSTSIWNYIGILFWSDIDHGVVSHLIYRVTLLRTVNSKHFKYWNLENWNWNSPLPPRHHTWKPNINSYYLYMLFNSLLYVCCFLRVIVANILPLYHWT